MSKINWEITDPVTRSRRIVVIEITPRNGSYDFEARFSDDRTSVIADGSHVGATEAEVLALAKRLVMDARII